MYVCIYIYIYVQICIYVCVYCYLDICVYKCIHIVFLHENTTRMCILLCRFYIDYITYIYRGLKAVETYSSGLQSVVET